MSSEKNVVATLFGFLAGVAIGAGLALLFAPQTGKETRKKIKDASEKVTEELKENYEKVTKEVKLAADSGIGHVKSFVNNTKHAIEKND